MNTSQGALYFGAGIDLQQWRRDVDSMRRDIAGLSQTVSQESRNMDSSFKNLSIGIASYFSVGAIKSFVMELINVRGEFQKTEIAFTTMLGNAGQAKGLMNQMIDLAAKTPFSLQDVSSGAKQLLAFQIPANEVVDTLTRLGNIAAGLSVPLARINLVYGQVRAKGKLMGDDLRQFTEAGIPMVAELAKKFNKTTAEISAMVSAGKIGFKDVKDVLFSMTNEGGMFFNLMEKQSASLSGQISNLGDSWDQMMNKIGESQESILSDGIQGLNYLVEHYQEVAKVLLTLIEIYGAYRAALILTSVFQTRIATPAIIQGFVNLINIIKGATVAQETLNAATIANPYVLVATLIAGLIAVTYNYRKELGELLGIIEKQTTAQKIQDETMQKYNDNFGKGVIETKAAIQQLIYVIKSEYSSLKQREEAYKKLIAIDSTFVGTLDNQYRATTQLNSAYENLIKNLQKMAMAQAEVAVRAEKFKQFAEAEMNLGITQVKLDDAVAQVKELTKQYKEGKITKDQYFKALDKTKASELNIELAKQKNIYKDITKEKEYVQKLDQKEISNLLKGNEILKAQIRGGKVQGKLLTPEGKKALEAQLANNENILKLRFGVEPEIEVDAEAIKGWAQKIKDKIAVLEEEMNSTTSQSRYYELQEKIKKLNELLNPKVKKDNRQIAELLPEGSIKELQRRASLIQEAIDTAVNGQVKLRTLDKYGKDKDKKGNPYLTGEVISRNDAEKRYEELEARIKSLQYKSFQERIAEAERQWDNYYNMAEFYGKETADAQYKELFNGAQNYLEYLEKQEKALKGLSDQGIITSQQKLDLVFLNEKIRSLNGKETPFENWKRDIDNTLKRTPLIVDYLDKIKDLEKESLDKSGGNNRDFLKQKVYFEELRRNASQEQKDQYIEFLNDHRTFEDSKTQITRAAEDNRKRILADKSLSENDKQDLTKISTNQEKETVSKLAFERLQSSSLWKSLYDNIDNLTAYQIDRLLVELEKRSPQLTKAMTPTDYNSIVNAFRMAKQRINDENPFVGVINSFKRLLVDINTGTEETANASVTQFDRIADSTVDIFKGLGKSVDSLGNFREYLSESANDALDSIQMFAGLAITVVSTTKASISAIKEGIKKGELSSVILAILQIIMVVIKAVISLFTWFTKLHDKRLQKEINRHKDAVNELKIAYDELSNSIKKALGDDTRKLQLQQIRNLQQQNEEISKMRDAEDKKKKTDNEKLNTYDQQISDNKAKIADMQAEIIKNILQTDAYDAASKLGDALVDAFSRGENASESMRDAANSMIQDIVKNALKLRIEKQIQPLLDSLLGQMGFDSNGNGSFKGLTPEQIEKFKAQVAEIGSQQQSFLDAYKEIFSDVTNSSQSVKGDIKGLTEKTGGALESQFNAIRINIVAVLKIMQTNQTVANSQTLLLSKIEAGTNNLHQMRKDLAEMNSKIKNGLAGI